MLSDAESRQGLKFLKAESPKELEVLKAESPKELEVSESRKPENIETLKRNQENRQYTPRVLQDLKCAKKRKEKE